MTTKKGAAATAAPKPEEKRGGEVVALRPDETSISLRPGQAWWSDRQLVTLKNLYPKGDEPSDADLMNFLHICLTTGLDPFRREIYYIGRSDSKAPNGKRFTAQTGIDGFRHIAERTGEFAGKLMTEWCDENGQWRDVWLSSKPPAAARVAVARRGIDHPFYGIAVYSEFVPMTQEWEGSGDGRRKKVVDGKPVMKPMGLWEKMPSHMLAKCAEAQAIRSAFPRQLAGLYVDEEMHQADTRDTRDGQRKALADRPWAQRTGVVLEPPVEVVEGEVALPAREAMLEELANQARIMGRTLGQWTTRWAAARKKNVEDADDRELWDLVTSRREMVAAKAAEQGVEPFVATAGAQGPGDAGGAASDPQDGAQEAGGTEAGGTEAETERDNEAFESARRGDAVDAEVVREVPDDPGSAGLLHRFRPSEDDPEQCGYLGCQMDEGDTIHGAADVPGQESLL